MTALCLILFLAVVSLWFFANEYPILFGAYATARVIRRPYFKSIVVFCMLAAVFSLAGETEGPVIDSQSLIIVLISSLLILLVLKRLSINGSAVYAVLGALEAWRISAGYDPDYGIVLSFLAAPVMSFCISALIRWILRTVIDRMHIHLITLSYYMSFAVVAGIVLLAIASGMNWGGFLATVAGMIAGPPVSVWAIAAVLVLSLILISFFTRNENDGMDGIYSDFSMYAVLSVGYAVALTMLFFSFEGSAGLLGLRPVPLSAGSLVFAAIAGAEVVKRSHLVEMDDHAKEGLALVLAPLGSLVLSYLLFDISGRNDNQMVDFTVIAAAVLALLALVFSGYMVRNRRQREATDRLVYIQQQQIYEHSRALNDMELKVVVSENQALHNAVEMKKQEVMNVALSIVEQKEYLLSLNETVKKLAKSQDEKERDALIAELGSSLSQRLSYDRDVDSQYFYARAESLHEDFNAKLAENFPDLTQQERRLATLLRLGFSSKYIATLMNITVKSVEISRYRLRQKLGLSKGDNLVNYIKSI